MAVVVSYCKTGLLAIGTEFADMFHGREVTQMPRGFGRGGGWWGWGPYGGTAYPFGGWGGRGNPFGFCRWFPWLPRWWWATPYASSYAATIPYGGYGYPYYGMGYGSAYGSPGPEMGYGFPYGYPGYGTSYPGTTPPPAEKPPPK